MHIVYILYSPGTGRYYCGETAYLRDRYLRHNSGRSKATKSGRPWEIIKIIEVESRAEARHMEKKIKGSGIQRLFCTK